MRTQRSTYLVRWLPALAAMAAWQPSQAATPQVAVGVDHMLLLASDGTVQAAGSDAYGKLGRGRLEYSAAAIRVAGVPTIAKVGKGVMSLHTMVIGDDRSLWGWGSNVNGQLGDGTTVSRVAPTLVRGTGAVVDVAMGGGHTLALKSDGSVLAWGLNHAGQLGDGTQSSRNVPTPVAAISDVVAIAAGVNHSLALRRDGSLWAWGLNEHGQLGDGTQTNRNTPVRVQVSGSFASAAGGLAYSVALRSDGTVFTWGNNEPGPLGDFAVAGGVRKLPEPVAALAGVRSIAVGGIMGVALRADGSVLRWPGGSSRAPALVSGISDIVAVDASINHIVALERNGTIRTQGWNGMGELGDGTNTLRSQSVRVVGVPPASAVATGGHHSLARTADGALWVWGRNDLGQLATGESTTSSIPVPVAGLDGVIEVSAGLDRSVALRGAGEVWSWGVNFCGQLGDGGLPDGGGYVNSSVPVRVKGLSRVQHVSAGWQHTLALDADGSVWSWGCNSLGVVGNGTLANQPLPVRLEGLSNIVAIATQAEHSLALRSDGMVFSWGPNGQGQLGDGSTTSSRSPVQVRGLDRVIAIAAGQTHSLALERDGTVWAWGANTLGQLGTGGGTASVPARVGTLQRIVSIIAGGNHSFAVQDTGKVWAWGLNSSGQLGDGTTASRGTPRELAGLSTAQRVHAGANASAAVLAEGAVLAWGHNGSGLLANGGLANAVLPEPVVASSGNAALNLLGRSAPAGPIGTLPFFALTEKIGAAGIVSLTDARKAGLSGEVFFTAIVASDSPLLGPSCADGCAGDAGASPGSPRRTASGGVRPAAAARTTMLVGTLTPAGFKQTGGVGAAAAQSFYAGPLDAAGRMTVMPDRDGDALNGSSALICMGVTTAALSAKGQVLMRPIATGTAASGVLQCPPVQTAATLQRFRVEASGPITARTIAASIDPAPEDRGQPRKIFSWAVAPDGRQFMQTGANQWEAMTEPMAAAASFTVPDTGPVRVEITRGLDLSALEGTLVFIGIGSSWEDVRTWNKAGQYYRVQ